MIDESKKISIQEAYTAMYKFLEKEYELTGSDDLGGMLGSMSLLDDGSTADPAIWNDWIEVLEKVLVGKDSDIRLHINGDNIEK